MASVPSNPPEVEIAVALNPIIEEDPTEYRETSLFCSCVSTARWLGAPLPKGNAEDFTPNANLTDVGVKAVLLRYGELDHVAYIEKLGNDGLHIAEGNFDRCKLTYRVLEYGDPAIKGYWKPV